jgi:hypothetical protein
MLTTTIGGGAWVCVALVSLVVGTPWFVSSTRSGPSPPAASTLSSPPWSALGGRTASFKLTPLTRRAALAGLVGSETTMELESKLVALWPTFPLSYLLPQGVQVQVVQSDRRRRGRRGSARRRRARRLRFRREVRCCISYSCA